MPLRGELQSVDLAHILQMLVLNQKAGTLEIVHDGASRALWFAPAGILVPYEPEMLDRRAVSAMVRTGQLTEDQVRRANQNRQVGRKDLLETLIEMSCLTQEEALSARRVELEEDAYELFFVEGASFEFRDEDVPDEVAEYDASLALSANGVIMEAARRIDEWEFIRTLVASDGDVVDRARDVEGVDLDVEARAVLEAIDGTRTVTGIISQTSMSRFQVFRNLAALVDQGIVRSVARDELVERAQASLATGHPESAIALFDRALELGADDVASLAGAGRCFETVDRPADAADRYLRAGRRAEQDGDVEAALKLYMRVRTLVPSRVEARERLFALRHLTTGQFDKSEYDARAEGFELAEILFELDRKEELAFVLAGLIDLAGRSPASVEGVADLAARLGQAGFAIDALTRASDLHTSAKRYRDATRVLKAAQAIDPNRRELTERLQGVSAHACVRRQRTRTALRVTLMAGGFALLFFGYGRYSKAAMDHYAEYSIEDFMVTGRFHEGKSFYEGVVHGYPLTIPFLLSFEKLRELEVAERNHAEVEQYRTSLASGDGEERLRQARGLKEAASNARHTGEYETARKLLGKARDLTGADDPLDLEPAIATLDEYLSAAMRLSSEATFYRNAGRFEEAHDRLSELTRSYPNAPDARSATLPVRVSSEPARARVFIDGAPVTIGTDRFKVDAETPFVIDLPPRGEIELRLELDGYEPATKTLRASDSAEVGLDLPKRPDLVTILPGDLKEPPVTDGDVVVCALKQGRIAALDASTLETLWIEELDDLREVCAPPAIFDGVAAVPIGPDQILLFDRAGRVTNRMSVDGRPASRPALAGGRLAVRLAGGGLAIGRYGARLAAVDVPTEVLCGPIPLSNGTFAVGGRDGNVWICRPDGSLSTVSHSAFVVGGVTALSFSDGRLAFGDGAGGVFVHDVARGEFLSQADALVDAIGEISIFGDTVIATSGDRAVAVEVGSGRVLDSLTDDAGLRLAEGGTDRVALATGDGRIFVRTRLGLGAWDLFAAGSPVIGSGVVAGTQAFFAAAGGKVVSIFLPSHPRVGVDR